MLSDKPGRIGVHDEKLDATCKCKDAKSEIAESKDANPQMKNKSAAQNTFFFNSASLKNIRSQHKIVTRSGIVLFF